MLDIILKLDEDLFLFLNKFHTPFFDEVMHFISKSEILMSLILAFVITASIYFFRKKSVFIIFFIIFNFGLTDSISSRVFKPTFERLRPCKVERLEPQVHTYGNCYGGKYGFVSSHAANTFGLALILLFIFKTKISWISIFIPYSFVVSFSRIYLGKHYPLDLICGWILAILCTLFSIFILKKSYYFLWKKHFPSE